MTLEQSKKANQRTNFVANLKFDTKFLGFRQFFIVRALTGFGNLSGLFGFGSIYFPLFSTTKSCERDGLHKQMILDTNHNKKN